MGDNLAKMMTEAQSGLQIIKEMRSKEFQTESPEMQLQELRRAIKQSRKMMRLVQQYPVIGRTIKPLKQKLDKAEKELKERMKEQVG